MPGSRRRAVPRAKAARLPSDVAPRMMNTPRDVGQRLPNRGVSNRRRGPKKPPPSAATHLHVHPYTLAFGLGRQIRIAVPLHEIAAELDSLTQKNSNEALSDPRETAAGM